MIDSCIIPQVVWITGLSGAGKTTVAEQVSSLLKQEGYNPVVLDGDEVRTALGADKQHTLSERKALALIYARMAKLFMEQGHIVICSTISMYNEVHEWRHKNISALIDVYLTVPMTELQNRNSKGLYESKSSKAQTNVVGSDIPVDLPPKATLTIDNWGEFKKEDSANAIFKSLLRKDKRTE